MAKKDPEGGFVALRSMPQEYLAAVQTELRTGKGVTSIARMIQGEWGLLKDMKENSLVKMLLRFRDKVLVAPLAIALEGDTHKVASMAKRVENQMNALAHMETLVGIQMERINELREKEKSLKMPFQWAGKEIDTAANMVKDLLKMQMDTGVVEYRGPLLNKAGQAVQVTTPDGTKVMVGSQEMLRNALLESVMELQQEGFLDVEAREVTDEPSQESGEGSTDVRDA